MSSASSTAYIMEDPREAMRLELKVDPDAWVSKYVAHHVKPGSSVLSVGCGPAVILQAICSKHSSIQGTGIDVSAGRVQQAIQKHRSNPRLRFVHGDAQAMPFPSDSFDVVYARMLFEYLPNKEQVASEMVRVCRHGGTVLIQDLDGQLLWNFPEDPTVQRAVEKVVASLANTGFDPFVGRKLFWLAHKSGLQNIDVQVECYHLVAGKIDPSILKQWELKLDIAMPQIARIVGDKRVAEEQAERFLDYLRRPDSLTYSNVFTVAGQKALEAVTSGR
jgi:ubiquinone/menaquinone biosynthesis C-methylase UbiE